MVADGYRSRQHQVMNLPIRALYSLVDDRDDAGSTGAALELYIKEQPRGEGYVCDFVYNDPTLPVTVYGVIIRDSSGLMIGELELFRTRWGYVDDYGDYVGPDGDWRGKDDHEWDASVWSDESRHRPEFVGISGALLRRLPLGRIIDWATSVFVDEEWRDEGLQLLGPGGVRTVPVADLDSGTRRALERTTGVGKRQRGRPRRDQELLERVAFAYLEEVKRGRGLTRRLALRFNCPSETVRDWIHAARQAGYLSPGLPGRRGAFAGARLRVAYHHEEQQDEGATEAN